MNIVKSGIYEHYKGKRYKVISVAQNSETLEDMVVYQALYGKHKLWARPLKMFAEKVEVNGKRVLRFKHIADLPKQLK